MKKRIACALLTLVMLVSLVNAGALTASAASGSTSEAAITVLKKMVTKRSHCEQLGKTQTFVTGYGTVCNEPGHKVNYEGDLVTKPTETTPEEAEAGEKKPEETKVIEEHKRHYISEKEADKALREALAAIDQKVDAFASANGLRLTQAQNDALNIFTFVVGSSWMNGTGTLKTLLKSGPSYNDLLDAMMQVNNNNDDRCGVFANMYVNGVYSNILPTNKYRSVEYNPNGGIIARTAVPGAVYKTTYDPSVSTAHLVTPTREGYIFMGWYDENNTLVTTLPKGSGDTVVLKAEWQQETFSYEKAAITVNYTISFDELQDNGSLYTKPINDPAYRFMSSDGQTHYTIKNIAAVDKNKNVLPFEVDRCYVDSSGQKWFRIKGTTNRWVMAISAAPTGSYVNKAIAVNYTMSSEDVSNHTLYTQPINKAAYYHMNRDGETAVQISDFYFSNDKWLTITFDRYYVDGKNQEWLRISGTTDRWIKAPSGIKNPVSGSTITVEYDLNGGTCKEASKGIFNTTYDPSKSTDHKITETPTRAGYVFMGWYDSSNMLVVSLPTSSIDTVKLIAKWQKTTVSYDNPGIDVNHTISPSELTDHHLFTKPINDKENYVLGGRDGKTPLLVENIPEYVDSNNKLKNLPVDKFFVDGAGQKWFRISDANNRWIMASANVGGSAGGSSTTVGTAVDVAVTVTNAYVNARQSASAASAQVGSYKIGTKLRIIRTTVVNGMTWGQVAKSDTDSTPVAWVCLMYTNWGEVGQNAGNTGNSGSTTGIATAVVNYNGYVNVRKGAGTDNQIVGSLKNGQVVSLYEIKTVNGHQWGRSDAGWFCLTYATVTMQNGTTNPSVNVSDQGALSYTFNGKLAAAATAYVSPSTSVDKTADQPEINQSVILSNMVSGSDGSFWAKIGWPVTKWVDGGNGKNLVKQQYTAYGWVKLGAQELSAKSSPVSIDPVSYTVVSNLTIRKSASSADESLFTMNPGTQFQVSKIQLVGEGIWGYTASDGNKFDVAKDPNANTSDENTSDENTSDENTSDENTSDENTSDVNTSDANTPNGSIPSGWVNLSTKYVKRTTLPNVPANQITTSTGKVATIVNTDSVRVRAAADIYSRQVGSLSRGATANVLEISADGKWYRLDVDPDKNPETESWVYKDYVSVSDSSASNGSGSSVTVQNPDGTTTTTTTVGTGIVANTYAGLNVRSGAGTNYPLVGGKLLPGTAVEIDQIVTVGASKWGHCKQGWVCMDYITMISSTVTETTTNNGNGTPVQSLDKVDKTTTTAIYTGKTTGEAKIYAEPNRAAEIVKVVSAGTQITMHELVAVKEIVDNTEEKDDNPNGTVGGSVTTITETTYWARVNGGYIYNPKDNITLDPLDEKVHTLTGNETLNVRKEPNTSATILGQLKKGDQVKVTALKIDYDKVWGRIDYDETEDAFNNGKQGWIRLDYMSEGAYYTQQTTTNTVTNNYGTGTAQAGIGNTGNTGSVGGGNTGGVSTGNTGATGSGYRYTGKVINTNELNVRQTASTGAKKTTVLKNGASLVIYETTISEGMAWGRCDAGWVYLYYVDLTPATAGVLDARVVYNDNTVIYSDANGTSTVGTYAKMSVIDIYEIVGKMARTDQGWVHTDNLLQ